MAEVVQGGPEMKKRIFLGMDRPNLSTITNCNAYIMCSCGQILQHVAAGQQHWQMGHFDKPVYKYVEVDEAEAEPTVEEGLK
jgi:hypothetical protein